MKKVSLELTAEQLQSVLNSLSQSYYKLEEIASKAKEENKKDWEGVANDKLELIDYLEQSTGINTFGKNSFRAVL